jgi:hypothetical protein
VPIAGGRHFADYTLRAALDALLANHLSNVEVLTAGRGDGLAFLVTGRECDGIRPQLTAPFRLDPE